jgi:hypothetical protein
MKNRGKKSGFYELQTEDERNLRRRSRRHVTNTERGTNARNVENGVETIRSQHRSKLKPRPASESSNSSTTGTSTSHPQNSPHALENLVEHSQALPISPRTTSPITPSRTVNLFGYFCVPPPGLVGFNVYNGNTFQYRLDMSLLVSPHLYSSKLTVLEDDSFSGRFCFHLDGINWKEEDVNNGRNYLYFQHKTQSRTWKCDGVTLNLAAVIYDQFNPKHSSCSKSEQDLGWNNLLSYIGSSLVQCGIGDYLSDLRSFSFGDVELSVNYDSSTLLDALIKKSPLELDASSELFIKWILLLSFIRRGFKSSLRIEKEILPLLEKMNPLGVCQLIKAGNLPVITEHMDVIKEICSKIVELQRPECIPWALLRLSLSDNSPSEKLLKLHPNRLLPSIANFLPYIPPDVVPLGFLPNLRVLQSILENNKSITPDIKTIKKIIENSDYLSNLYRAGAVEGRAELGAMHSFARTSPFLLKEFLDHPLFQAHSFATANLNTFDFIDVTLMQFAKLHPPRHVLVSRCASVSSCLALRSSDDDFPEGIYKSLHVLFTSPVPEEDLIFKTLHSSLPNLDEKGLRLRLKCYLNERNDRLVEIEKNSFGEIFDHPGIDIFKLRSVVLWETFAKEDGLLSTSNPSWTRLAFLLSLVWNKSLEQSPNVCPLSSTERELISSLFPEKDASDYTFLLLSSDRVRELHDLISMELSEFPHLTEEPTYEVICKKYTASCSNIYAFASRLKESRVLVSTVDIVLRHDGILKNLQRLSNFLISKDTILDIQLRIATIREEWESMLVMLEFLSLSPHFAQCHLAFLSDYHFQLNAMQCEEIRHWKLPSFGGGDMETISKTLNIARGSFLYHQLASQIEQKKEIPVSSDPAVALSQWKESLNQSFQSWTSVISRIVDGSFSSMELISMIQSVIDGIPECPEIPNNEVRARDTVSRHAVQVQEYLKNVVNQETKLSSSLMKSLKKPFEVNDFSEPLLKFLSAMEFSSLGKGLKELFSLLNYHCDPADPLIQLIEEVNSPSNNTVATISTLYVRTKTLYPEVFQIVQEFPSDLAVLIREDFLSLLNEIIDMRSLNQTIERLQNQVEPELLNELYALRNVYNALAFDVEGFTALKLKNPRDLRSACSYFATVGWCLSEMKALIGAVGKLTDLYSRDVSRTSAVALVHALVSNGEYLITLPGSVMTAVVQMKKGETKVLNPVELDEIPFQLCLHGSVTDSKDDSVDTSNQRSFLQTMELLNQVREALAKLSINGHPDFQERILKISGSISSTELEELVSQYQLIDSDWQAFLSESLDINLPLLTCMSRKQLVESLKILTHPNSAEAISSFVLIFRSVYPLMSAEQADLHVRSVLLDAPVVGAKPPFEQIHDLLERGSTYLFPSPIQKTAMLLAACSRFHPLVPTKLNPPSGVSLMKLRSEDKDKHCELCCSLFIQLYSRLPTSLEVFQCTQETSEQSVIDFLRRWAASQHFQKFFPGEERSFLFCVLNVESLKPNIQNTVLKKINFFRTSVTYPLVLFASSDPRQESLLCLGLRKDWVIESNEQLTSLMTVCQLVCEQFFKLKFPQIYFVTSPFPQSGKSSLIIEDFVVRDNSEDSLLYCRIPLTEDLNQVTQLLVSVGSDREKLRELDPEANTNAVLHFNVSSIFDIQQLNLFIMSYVVTGVCMNSNGSFCIRNPHDVIAIEWPSEGVLADRAFRRSGLCSSFHPKSPKNLVNLKSPEYIPCLPSDDCILFRLQMRLDSSLELGVKMAVAFFQINRSDSNNLLMPSPDEIVALDISDSEQLFHTFSRSVSEGLGDNASLSLPPGLVYRFIRFFSRQLYGLFHFSIYQSVETNHNQHYRRLAYYLAMTSFQLAIRLAASAALPLTGEVDDNDHDKQTDRLSNLNFSFEDWKSPFLIFNVGDEDCQPGRDYTMVSVTDKSFLTEITSTDPNLDFIEFIQKSVHNQEGNLLQNLCARLNDENGNYVSWPATDSRADHPLRALLPILNVKPNYGHHIFAALDFLHSDITIAPDTPITILGELYPTALDQLRSMTGSAELGTSTVSEFKQAAENWIESMMGSNDAEAEQSPFVLTIDNLIRLLAMKLRISCRTPVFFMGETGCGKVRSPLP